MYTYTFAFVCARVNAVLNKFCSLLAFWCAGSLVFHVHVQILHVWDYLWFV